MGKPETQFINIFLRFVEFRYLYSEFYSHISVLSDMYSF